jgi:pyruvate/2-oxoglutarate dehydrogenase complex dihydrolipoamide acyltransferase (E2) component
MLLANSTYVVEVNDVAEVNEFLPGLDYDQINVQGTVDVTGAVLSISGGSFRPDTGTIFTLIENDNADPIEGRFAGLSDGATVRFGGIEATISYFGGTGNDITLTVTELKIVRSIAPDAVVLIDETGGGAASFTQKSESPPLIIVDTARPVTIAQSTDTRPQGLEMRSVERLRVFLKVVDEVTGQEEGKAVDLDPRVIDDVLGFFQRYRFPNGRYRIYLQEAGKSPRLIIEIAIRDGRAVSPEDQPAPAKPEAPAQPAAPAADPASPAASEAAAQHNSPMIQVPRSAQASARQRSEADHASVATSPVHRWTAAAAPLAAGLALAAAAPNWRKRISRLLATPGQLPRTRFHRRLPQPSKGTLPTPT